MCVTTSDPCLYFLCLASVRRTLAEVRCAERPCTCTLGSACFTSLPSPAIMFFIKCSFQNYAQHTLFTSSVHSTHLLLTHSANYNCVFITVKCQVLSEELGMELGKVSRGSLYWGRAGFKVVSSGSGKHLPLGCPGMKPWIWKLLPSLQVTLQTYMLTTLLLRLRTLGTLLPYCSENKQ